ncbi:hypothetical protein [Streptomyces sp. NPDC060205]|uniref:hypothetical protein n=1 Tax=Streptomyces sp. NPDC060205 TaxID=3347072 RepID=UPI003668DFD1
MDRTAEVVQDGNPWLARSPHALVAVALLVLSGLRAVPVADEYEGRQAYRDASVRPAGGGDPRADRLVPGTGRITDGHLVGLGRS